MGLFGWLFGGREDEPARESEIAAESYPWDQKPSIYEHIRSHIKPGERQLSEGWETLPDEEALASRSDSKLRWAAGAMDGVIGHHMGSSESQQEMDQTLSLIRAYCSTPTARNKAKVYQFLVEHQTLGFIDPLIEALVQQTGLNHDRLYDLAYSLATESPDRSPVKFGVAILGLFRETGNEELFHILGRHDEFTLFCAVALANTAENPEAEFWKLAQQVDGWGRIQIVERLAATEDPQIKEWLLREGFKNSVMNEYTACICARAGGLLGAMSQEGVDQEMLTSAGEIIMALISGGPAENLDDYEDGAAVVELYLEHLQAKATTLQQLLSVAAIQQFLTDDQADWDGRAERGWTPDKRKALLEQCSAIISQPQWRERVLKSLESQDRLEFWTASGAAKVLQIDTWEYHWRRLQQSPKDSSCWYEVMQRCNAERIAEVIAFAERHLPLSEVATGPGEEIGLGPGYETHGCLDYILQELGQYPGHGAAILQAAIKSPVIRNRHWALRVLSAWGKDCWPLAISPALEAAAQNEPDEEIRTNMKRLLAGERLEED